MFFNFLISSALICVAVAAEFKFLSNTNLQPSSEKAVVQLDVVDLGTTEDVPDLSKNEIVGNDIKLSSSESLTKDAYKDPIYGNNPFGYNNYPSGFPGAVPNQGFPGQIFPRPVFPPQGFPGPGFPPTHNFVNPGFPQPNFSGQGFPGQSFPGQGFPGQGFPGQVFPGQGFPNQFYSGQGFPGQVPPSQGFYNPGFNGQGYPNYPVYFSNSEQLNAEQKENNQDDKLRTRLFNSDTHYDLKNGGYVYEKPSKKKL